MWEKNGLIVTLKLVGNSLGYGYGPTFVLFKDYLAGTPGDHVYDDTKVCTFPGYAGIGLAYSAVPSLDGGGLGTAETNPMTWSRDTTGASEPVKAIGLLSAPAGSGYEELMWYDDAFASVNMVNAGDEFERVVKFGDDTLIVTP